MGCCADKPMLRPGTLPTSILLQVLVRNSFSFTSGARKVLDLFASFLPVLFSTTTADLQLPSATDKAPGHPYAESSSSVAGTLRLLCFFALAFWVEGESCEAASCCSRRRVEHCSMVWFLFDRRVGCVYTRKGRFPDGLRAEAPLADDPSLRRSARFCEGGWDARRSSAR